MDPRIIDAIEQLGKRASKINAQLELDEKLVKQVKLVKTDPRSSVDTVIKSIQSIDIALLHFNSCLIDDTNNGNQQEYDQQEYDQQESDANKMFTSFAKEWTEHASLSKNEDNIPSITETKAIVDSFVDDWENSADIIEKVIASRREQLLIDEAANKAKWVKK